MPDFRLVRAFFGLWWVLGVVLIFLSLQTVRSGLSAGPTVDGHAVVLGSIEALAALLFLLPQFMRVGGVVLLATFAFAFVVHAARGQFAGPLLVYGAAVLFVLVHGPVSTHLLSRNRNGHAV